MGTRQHLLYMITSHRPSVNPYDQNPPVWSLFLSKTEAITRGEENNQDEVAMN